MPPPPAQASHAPRAFAWMTVSSVGFALMNFFAHVASREVHWSLIVTTRALVGAAVAFTIARARGATLVIHDRRGLLLRSAFGTLSMFCTFFALASKALPLGDAVTLLNLQPVVLALLAPLLLGERSGRRVFVALPLCLAGVVLIVQPTFLFGHTALPPAALPAIFVSLLGAVSSGFAWIALRRIGPRESAEGVTFWFSLFAAASSLLVAVPHFAMPSIGAIAGMIAAGVCGGIAQIAVTRAHALEHTARLAGLAYFTVAVDATLGALALREWPSAIAAAGIALIVTGGLVVTLVSVREHARMRAA